MADIEPAILERLPMQKGARIGCGERNLDRVRVDLRGKPDGFVDRLPGFTRKPEDERPVDRDAELVAILGKAPGDVDPHPFLDVVQDLLVPRFIADQQKPQPVVAQHLECRARYVGFCIAGPGDAELAEFAGDRLGTRTVVGERVVIEEEFLHLWEIALREADFVDDMANAAYSVAMSADGLRP